MWSQSCLYRNPIIIRYFILIYDLTTPSGSEEIAARAELVTTLPSLSTITKVGMPTGTGERRKWKEQRDTCHNIATCTCTCRYIHTRTQHLNPGWYLSFSWPQIQVTCTCTCMYKEYIILEYRALTRHIKHPRQGLLPAVPKRKCKPWHRWIVFIKGLCVSVRTAEDDFKFLACFLNLMVCIHQLRCKGSTGSTLQRRTHSSNATFRKSHLHIRIFIVHQRTKIGQLFQQHTFYSCAHVYNVRDDFCRICGVSRAQCLCCLHVIVSFEAWHLFSKPWGQILNWMLSHWGSHFLFEATEGVHILFFF